MLSLLRSLSSSGDSFPANKEPSPTLSELIARRHWAAARNVLSTESGRKEARSDFDASPNVDGVLQYVCRSHPPVDVVRSVSRVFPGSIAAVDGTGKLPLHVAAEWGASPPMIKWLIEAMPEAAAAQEDQGKTALHLACESYQRNYAPFEHRDCLTKEATLEVVKALCDAAPTAVNLEDHRDMTALEYAIDAEVDREVVRVIQKASEKDWKNRHAENRGRGGHEAISKIIRQESRLRQSRSTFLQLTSAATDHIFLSKDVPKITSEMEMQFPVSIKPSRNTANAATA